MAKIIELELPGTCEYDDHYFVKQTDERNYSGRYIRESEYNALLERHRRLVAVTTEFTGWPLLASPSETTC